MPFPPAHGTDTRPVQSMMGAEEEELRLVFESIRDYGIFTTDTQGCVTRWNTGAQAAFGYSPEEMLGASSDILFTAEDRERG